MDEDDSGNTVSETFFDLSQSTTRQKGRVWVDTLNEFFYDYESRLPTEFSFGRLSGSHVGGLSIAHVESDPMTVWRTTTQIERDGLDAYFVLLPTDHRISLQQRSREAEIDGNGFALVSTSTPYVYTQDRTTAFDNLIIPGPLMREASPFVDDLVAIGRGAKPVDRLLIGYARSFCSNSLGLDDNMKRQASRHVVELLGAALDGADLNSNTTPVRMAHRRRFMQLVERSFADPSFDLDKAAATLRLSRRYLQEVLSTCDLSFSRIVRERRLREAHRHLQDRQRSHLTVTQIAFRTGFNDLAHFSRVYKRRFGHAPKDTARS